MALKVEGYTHKGEEVEVEVLLSDLAHALEEAAEEEIGRDYPALAENLMEAAAALQRASYDCQICGRRYGH